MLFNDVDKACRGEAGGVDAGVDESGGDSASLSMRSSFESLLREIIGVFGALTFLAGVLGGHEEEDDEVSAVAGRGVMLPLVILAGSGGKGFRIGTG